MLIYFAGLIAGLLLLVVSADRFVFGTAAIARNLGIPPLIIGLTIVGFGTSAPEILVSAIASWQGNPGLAVGNALGSNIANIGLILGCTALIMPIAVHSRTLRRELPILLLTSLGCYGLSLYGGLNRIDGLIMVVGLIVFLAWLTHTAIRHRHDPLSAEIEKEVPHPLPTSMALLWFIIGLIGLLLSSRLLVWSAVQIAKDLGVSDLIIGLTIVALGTSLPELATSIAGVLKKEDDLVIGNIIGSNMYNLLAVYSLAGIIHPGPLEPNVLTRDFPWMIGFTCALFLIAFQFRAGKRINRLEGGLLLGGYCSYQALLYQSTF